MGKDQANRDNESGEYNVLFRPWEPADAPDEKTAQAIQRRSTRFFTFKFADLEFNMTESEALALRSQMDEHLPVRTKA